MSVINPVTMMLASDAVSAVGTLHSMKAQKAALSRENVRYERERKVAALDAIEQENIRKDMLNETLANNMAFQSAAGYYDDSRSFLNISKQAEKKSEKDISNIRLQGQLIDQKYRDQMFENYASYKSNEFGGYVSIISGLATGYGNYDWYKGSKGVSSVPKYDYTYGKGRTNYKYGL